MRNAFLIIAVLQGCALEPADLRTQGTLREAKSHQAVELVAQCVQRNALETGIPANVAVPADNPAAREVFGSYTYIVRIDPAAHGSAIRIRSQPMLLQYEHEKFLDPLTKGC